ncbi:allophanate hydrolase [Haloplanus halophilus]|uniref:allophanate hydrolase n=1 Tax=Haloplanus halophilus TaxID=2949993 RepID=UPI00203B7A8D|nr:allophanate hydrolase [Haloplanus sp. GDY1]
MGDARTVGFGIESLREAYAAGTRTPTDVVDEHLSRAAAGPDEVWIHRLDGDTLRERAAALEAAAGDGIDWERRPLYGIPFAVKDNVDHAGSPTTAACPAYEYSPDDHATVVERLLDAGAILVGKTNLDQFATGLVGTRSPYGAPPNAVDPEYISGGSSSGSGVAVALGQVAFALGTDTAGSGRVPAALNGIVGLKPSRGMLSTEGVVPACKSLDCVSIFATTCRDALAVERAAAGFDPADEYSRRQADEVTLTPTLVPDDVVVGVPESEQLSFFGDEEAAACFEETVEWFDRLWTTRPVDITPFLEAGKLLYQGPWVAERLAAIQDVLATDPDALLPITREIITRGREFSAVDAYTAEYELRRLERAATDRLEGLTAVLTPTTGTTYTHDEVDDAPIERNSTLGHYTNFVNLLDLSAVAVPGGRRPSGLPFGVTLFADAFEDALLASIADAYCTERNVALGALGDRYDERSEPADP